MWLAITKAPGETASPREKEVWAALSGAILAYLNSVIIKPDAPLWNPVKGAITSVFKGDFGARRDNIEKDAREASHAESYGAMAHPGDQIRGWDWNDRRMRNRHLQDAVNRGYLTPP